jgi:hypothetical protein
MTKDLMLDTDFIDADYVKRRYKIIEYVYESLSSDARWEGKDFIPRVVKPEDVNRFTGVLRVSEEGSGIGMTGLCPNSKLLDYSFRDVNDKDIEDLRLLLKLQLTDIKDQIEEFDHGALTYLMEAE